MDHGFFVDLLHRYGPGIIGLVILLESTGLPLPGESLLIGAALYASTTGKLDIWQAVGLAALGAVLGDNIGYVIGRSLGAKLLVRYGRHVGLTAQRLELGTYLFRRHGGKLVFFGRFIVLLRTFAALLAGATHMHWKQFVVYNALGGIVWCGLYGFGAYALGDAARRLSGPIGISIGVVAACALVGAVVFVKRNEARLIDEAKQAVAQQK